MNEARALGAAVRLGGRAAFAIVAVLGVLTVGTAVAAPSSGGVSLSIGDPAYRDCIFQQAGVTRQVTGLDQLDRDLIFLFAASDRPEDFLTRQTRTNPPRAYGRVFSAAGAARLQRLARARAACRNQQDQVLQAWPLESARP